MRARIRCLLLARPTTGRRGVIAHPARLPLARTPHAAAASRTHTLPTTSTPPTSREPRTRTARRTPTSSQRAHPPAPTLVRRRSHARRARISFERVIKVKKPPSVPPSAAQLPG
ncbi:hypothetical protein B0H16DRAFT_1742104 [Mycena metata]|uniref:Uncharacterized protein n=1 Tax=Mycena metata TaxID=1033252 RepID=A0AAD7MFU7_9AGAR|nr:hypothetical protein B0H16DRAFT_1742104 [Mycena metata]